MFKFDVLDQRGLSSVALPTLRGIAFELANNLIGTPSVSFFPFLVGGTINLFYQNRVLASGGISSISLPSKPSPC